MKQRLPRKKKKQAKKIVAKKTAQKMAKCAVTVALSAFQTAHIASAPTPRLVNNDVNVAGLKALNIAQVAIETAQSISNIMSEKPISWKEFIKPSLK